MNITRQQIEAHLQKHGADLVKEGMILFGIRDESNPNADLFNDFIGYITPDDFGVFIGTTDPGVWYTMHPMAPPHGGAHYQNGYHKKLFARGMHYDQQAFRQVADAGIWRDDNKNFHKDPGDFEQVGKYGMNLHSAKSSDKIYNWSAGCQVTQKLDDLAKMTLAADALEARTNTRGRAYDYMIVPVAEL